MRFSLPPGRGFHGKMKNQGRSLDSVPICPSMLCFLVTADGGTSWLAQAETDQFTPHSSLLYTLTFAATVWSQVKLDWKEERDNKWNEAQAGVFVIHCNFK